MDVGSFKGLLETKKSEMKDVKFQSFYHVG